MKPPRPPAEAEAAQGRSPERLDALLEARSVAALVVVACSSREPFLAYFSGPARLGSSFVIAPRKAAQRLGYFTPMEREEAARSGLSLLEPEALDIVRWARESSSPGEMLAHVLSRAFHLCELAPGPVAIAGHRSAGEILEAAAHLAREGWSFVPGEDAVSLLRKTKSTADLEELRRVAAGTAAAFYRVAELLASAEPVEGELWLGGERLRVARLTSEIASTLARSGLEQPEGGICAAGREGAVPHNAGSPERVLRPHESLILDLFPKGALFVDCTRTFCWGEPPEALRDAHARVGEALALARRAAVPGRRGWSLQEEVCRHLADAGYPTSITEPGTLCGYVHGLGHGVGLDLHEYPYFKEESEGPEGLLEGGDVFTLEPGLYEPDEGWAVRLEDLYFLTDEGLESLLPLPYEMDPRAWVAGV